MKHKRKERMWREVLMERPEEKYFSHPVMKVPKLCSFFW
jgi:hypothetical protein